ncbi:hypothetical protein DSS3P8_184 [Roseobacter phage DSS3P8]|nr:hypothetical protein DSS3P8_184 [Roseobacter phage DSS3P8]
MNMREAFNNLTDMKAKGYGTMDILSTYTPLHQTGVTLSEDGSMAIFYFPNGVIIITPYGEIEQYGPVADTRPANCRERLREEGKSYPRSGCGVCGTNLRTGLVCKHA